MSPVPVLAIEDLRVEFSTAQGTLRAVDGVSLAIAPQETLAIVGESGSGKTVLARTIINLLAANGTRTGTIKIGGRDVDDLDRSTRKHFYGVEVAMVFQDPMTSLNPVKRIDAQLTEATRYHLKLSRSDAEKRAVELLRQVHMPSPAQCMRQYPHELSGGMRQRVVIAMALACEPQLLIADEPTTALDVTVQRTILDLLDELRAERDMAVMFITHDLGVAEGHADRVAVMYAGRIVERAPASTIFGHMRHPYTEALLNSIPKLDQPSHTPMTPIVGRPPDLLQPPRGCAFEPRCSYASDQCIEDKPLLGGAVPEHAYACFHPVGDSTSGGRN
jgi:peptide/nickel transport system ATP-binding protein